MSIIEVNHVTKECKLGQIQSLKTTALNQWRRFTGQPVEERAPLVKNGKGDGWAKR